MKIKEFREQLQDILNETANYEEEIEVLVDNKDILYIQVNYADPHLFFEVLTGVRK